MTADPVRLELTRLALAPLSPATPIADLRRIRELAGVDESTSAAEAQARLRELLPTLIQPESVDEHLARGGVSPGVPGLVDSLDANELTRCVAERRRRVDALNFELSAPIAKLLNISVE